MFLRLFSKILDSSLMDESPETRWLFLTMLVLADEAQTGVVDMPVKALAKRASLTVDQTEKSLAALSAPDPDSSSQVEEGRRIVPMEREPGFTSRGWIIVNWSVYKEIARAEAERERIRKAVAKTREKQKVTDGNGESLQVTESNSSEATSPASSPTKPKKENGRVAPPSLAEVEAFVSEKGLDVDPVKFFAYYESIGWRRGKNPIKKWKMAVWGWSRGNT